MPGLTSKDGITISLSILAIVFTGINFYWTNLRIHDEVNALVTRASWNIENNANGPTQSFEIDLAVANVGTRTIAVTDAYIQLAYAFDSNGRPVRTPEDQGLAQPTGRRLDSVQLPMSEDSKKLQMLKFVLPDDFFGGWDLNPYGKPDSNLMPASLQIITVDSDGSIHEAWFSKLFNVNTMTDQIEPADNSTFTEFPRISLLGPAPQ